MRRAIYIGQAHAMEVYGFAARGVEGRLGVLTQLQWCLSSKVPPIGVCDPDRIN